MATWAVGDVQGCFRTFRALLERIGYRRRRDRIWLVGDLVNRGPDSLGMLRWARDQGDSLRVVLGNHDLHLLAQREKIADGRERDTLAPVLDAPDAGDLCDWLAGQPFLHEEGRFLMVHAGLLPGWSLAAARRAAAGAGRALVSDRRGFLRRLYALRGDGRGAGSQEASAVPDRLGEVAAAASVLTRLRMVSRSGRPLFVFDGPPEAAPPDTRPWFDRSRLPPGRTVLFGHWAALGLMVSESAVCLDSGCVWGGSLTAMRLEDGSLTIQRAVPGDGRSL